MVRFTYIETVKRYHRLGVSAQDPVPNVPCLIVANHGFGGIFDLNIYATLAALESATSRPISVLTHQLAWTLGIGGIVEEIGAVPACRQSAFDAFRRGEHVLVFPGGDHDAAKPWARRNDVVFHGRTGFAQLALDAQVPIVPVVTAGAGESLIVLSDGARLAELLGLREGPRVETLPVSVSIPWGLSVGLAAILPYLPLPSKLDTVILQAHQPMPGQRREDLARQVLEAMQSTLTGLTRDRVPVLGNIAPIRDHRMA